MKKIFKTLAIVAVAALGFACQNDIDEQVNGNEGEKVTVEVVGSVADLTRSVFGAIDTENETVSSTWSKDQVVYFAPYQPAEGNITMSEAVVAEASATASFEIEFTQTQEEGAIYAFSPKGERDVKGGFTQNLVYANADPYIWLNVPAEQTTSATSCDEQVHVLYASKEYSGGFPTSVSMEFNHVLAYGKMNITNFAGGEITSVAITFPEAVAGGSVKYYYLSNTFDGASAETITVNNVDDNATIWFGIVPTESGEEKMSGNMTVVVTDSEGKTYTKPLATTGKLAFIQGQVSNFTVNMSDITADETEVYNGLTNAEIASAMSKVTDSYQEVTIKSSCGDWKANAYADKDTALQFRAKSGSYVLSPVFAKYIEKIDITFTSDVTKDRFVYAVPATIVENLPSSDYADAQYATNYGYVNTTVAGAQTLTLTFESPVQQFALLAKGGAVYVESIEVFLTDDFKVKEATTIELKGGNSFTVDLKEGLNTANNNFVEPTATVLDASDIDVEGAKLTYLSSDEEIATVATDGNVTFTGETGSVTITISYEGDNDYKGCSNKYTITVEDSSVAATVWKKATSVTAGKQYLLVCESKSMYLTSISTTSTKYGIGSSVTISNGTITSKVADSAILTAEAGSTSGTYSFKLSSGQYLYWSSGNSLATNVTKSDNSSWKVTISNETFTILNGKDNSRKLQWNASSPRFACYTSSQTAVQLYEKQ